MSANAFAIVEIENGLTIVEFPYGEDPHDVALRKGGILTDPGPYATYDEACDALANLQVLGEEEREQSGGESGEGLGPATY